MKLRKLLPLVLSVIVYSCAPSQLSESKLLTWLQDEGNDCTIKSTTSQLDFSCQYLPAEVMALKQIRVLGEDETDSAFLSLEKEYLKGSFFKLQITPIQEGLTPKALYDANSEYFNFQMANDLKLIQGADTSQCLSAFVERSAGLKPFLQFELAFDTPIKSDATLLYEGFGSEEGQPIQFKFSQQAIESIPRLKR